MFYWQQMDTEVKDTGFNLKIELQLYEDNKEYGKIQFYREPSKYSALGFTYYAHCASFSRKTDS